MPFLQFFKYTKLVSAVGTSLLAFCLAMTLPWSALGWCLKHFLLRYPLPPFRAPYVNYLHSTNYCWIFLLCIYLLIQCLCPCENVSSKNKQLVYVVSSAPDTVPDKQQALDKYLLNQRTNAWPKFYFWECFPKKILSLQKWVGFERSLKKCAVRVKYTGLYYFKGRHFYSLISGIFFKSNENTKHCLIPEVIIIKYRLTAFISQTSRDWLAASNILTVGDIDVYTQCAIMSHIN